MEKNKRYKSEVITTDEAEHLARLIVKLSKIPDLHSAYTDLCSAKWNIGKRIESNENT